MTEKTIRRKQNEQNYVVENAQKETRLSISNKNNDNQPCTNCKQKTGNEYQFREDDEGEQNREAIDEIPVNQWITDASHEHQDNEFCRKSRKNINEFNENWLINQRSSECCSDQLLTSSIVWKFGKGHQLTKDEEPLDENPQRRTSTQQNRKNEVQSVEGNKTLQNNKVINDFVKNYKETLCEENDGEDPEKYQDQMDIKKKNDNEIIKEISQTQHYHKREQKTNNIQETQAIPEKSSKNKNNHLPIYNELQMENEDLEEKFQSLETDKSEVKAVKMQECQPIIEKDMYEMIDEKENQPIREYDTQSSTDNNLELVKECQKENEGKQEEKDEIFEAIQNNQPIMEKPPTDNGQNIKKVSCKKHETQVPIRTEQNSENESHRKGNNKNEIMEVSCENHDIQESINVEQNTEEEWQTKQDEIIETIQVNQSIMKMFHRYDDDEFPAHSEENVKKQCQTEDDVNEENDRIRTITEVSYKNHDIQEFINMERNAEKECHVKQDEIIKTVQNNQPLMEVPHKYHDNEGNVTAEYQTKDDTNEENNQTRTTMELLCKNNDIQEFINVEQNAEERQTKQDEIIKTIQGNQPIMEMPHNQFYIHNKGNVKKECQIKDDVNEIIEVSRKNHDIQESIDVQQNIEEDWHIKQDEIIEAIRDHQSIMKMPYKYDDNVKEKCQTEDDIYEIMEVSCKNDDIQEFINMEQNADEKWTIKQDEIIKTIQGNQSIMEMPHNEFSIHNKENVKKECRTHDDVNETMEVSRKTHDIQESIDVEQNTEEERQTKQDRIIEAIQSNQPTEKMPDKYDDDEFPVHNEEDVKRECQTEDDANEVSCKNQESIDVEQTTEEEWQTKQDEIIKAIQSNQTIMGMPHKYDDDKFPVHIEENVKEKCQTEDGINEIMEVSCKNQGIQEAIDVEQNIEEWQVKQDEFIKTIQGNQPIMEMPNKYDNNEFPVHNEENVKEKCQVDVNEITEVSCKNQDIQEAIDVEQNIEERQVKHDEFIKTIQDNQPIMEMRHKYDDNVFFIPNEQNVKRECQTEDDINEIMEVSCKNHDIQGSIDVEQNTEEECQTKQDDSQHPLYNEHKVNKEENSKINGENQENQPIMGTPSGDDNHFSKIEHQLNDEIIKKMQRENENLLKENTKLLEQIRVLRKQLRLAGITPISQSSEAEAETEALASPNKNKKFDKTSSTESQSSVTCTYGKRRGTVDQGKEYEYLLAAFYALEFSTNDNVIDFEMATNDETYGDFDDLVITVKFVDGTTHTFLMQLKHSENKKNITERILTAEKGDFSLWKYFRSFKMLRSDDNITCILFTNRSSSIRDDSELFLGSQEIGVKQGKSLLAEDILNTNRSKRCSIFQFEVLEIDEESQELVKFFQKFYLLSSQSNCAKLKMSLNETLKNLLQCEIYENFVHFMKCWWSTNFILCKEIVIGKLAELAFSPSMVIITNEKCNEKTKLLEEAIMKFDLTIVKEYSDDIVGKIWHIDEQTILEAGLVAFNYGLATKRSTACQLSDEQRSKVLWYLNRVPLVVRVEDSKRDQIFSAIKLLRRLPQKKKLLLLGNVPKEEVADWNTFESLADLFNEKIYMEILQDFRISLQGRKCITLEKLIGSDTTITKVIGTRELFLMIETALMVGTQDEELPQSYISRTVTTVFLDTEKVLNNCDHANDLLIINCDEKFKKVFQFKDLEVMELYNYLQQIESHTNNHLIVLSTKNKCTKYQFDQICERTIKRHIYLLQIIDEKCCILVLSKENPHHLKEMGYLRPPIEEHEIHKIFDNPINVLCAHPGMGKSTLTTYLKSNCPSNFWSIRVNLKEYNTFLRKRPNREEILRKFLKLRSKEDSFLDQIKWAFLKNKKIYLFLDGLDEIESASVDFILDYIQYISSLGVHVWVCSRQNLQEVIVNELNMFSIDIQELNHRQQRRYIRERLSCKYPDEEILRITKDIFSNVDAARSQNLLGIPLKLFIITENFLDDKAMDETRNHQMFVLTTMYRIFFEGKKKHHYQKVGLLDEHQLGYNFFNLVLEQYEIPALRSCLDSDAFNRLNLDMTKTVEFLETVKNEGDKFGIINQIHDDEKAVFNHQTYAEYFACVWFKKNLDKVQLLKDVFFQKEYQNLKFMFDIMLAEKCPLHLAVIYRNFEQVRNYFAWSYDKDEGGRNPLQLICSYGTKQKPLNSDHDYQQRLSSNDREECNYQKIIKLVSKFDPLERDELFSWNSLDYSVASQSLYPIETILESHGSTFELDTLFNVYNDVALAYYSSKLGYQNLLKALLRRNLFIDTVRIGFEKISLLHVVVKGCNFGTNDDNVEIVKILIDHGVDVNVRDELGRTALHWAAEEGNHNMIKALLEEGADVNIVTNNEETILHYATKSWKQIPLETIQLLLESGVCVNAKDKFGITILHLASEKECYTMVEQLLTKGADVNATTNQCETILHYAVRAREPNTKVKLLRYSSVGMLERDDPKSSRQEGLVSLLLKSGANIDAVTKDEETILHYAAKAWKPNIEVIELLVKSGVNINAKNRQGISALHRAFQKGHYGVVKVLLENGADVNAVTKEEETILHYAARTLRPNTEIIQLLVESGVDINAKDKDGTSVLHWASEEGHYEIVKVLVENGADVNAVTSRGSTVLHYAAGAWKPNRDVMKLLATSGVDVSKQDKSGTSALHWVSDIGYCDVAKVLLDRGANVNALTNKDETALHYATKAKDPNLEVIDLLVSRGVDIDAKDNDGITALHWAAERGHYDIVKLLVGSGANVNTITNTKQTVLNYAVRSREASTAVIKLLVNSGVDVNSKDKDGISDLHWVAEIGHFDVVQLLLSKSADVNAVTKKQETVLHYAAIAREANTDVIALFMKSGVDADAKDVKGKTALHFAVERGLFENVTALVENGANVNAVTCHNLTALHLAVYRGRVEMVRLLIDAGIDLDNIDVYNEMIPLYFVAENGRLHVDWLLQMTEAIYNKFQLCYSYNEIAKFLREDFQLSVDTSNSTPSTSRSNSRNVPNSFDTIYQSIVNSFFAAILCKRRQSLKDTDKPVLATHD